jgi:hypothetical protein
MTDEPRTTEAFVDALIAERGGRDRFSAVQVRIAHAVATALRDPAEIDPGAVSRLIDLLPPRVFTPDPAVPIATIVFVDGFSHELERAINACKPDDDVGRMALQMANDRIAELEGENKTLRAAVDDYKRENEARVSPLRSVPPIEGTVTLDRGEYTPCPMTPSKTYAPRQISDAHSLAVNVPLEQRYPLAHLDPVT